jgi:hypothetical protein
MAQQRDFSPLLSPSSSSPRLDLGAGADAVAAGGAALVAPARLQLPVEVAVSFPLLSSLLLQINANDCTQVIIDKLLRGCASVVFLLRASK